VPVRGLLHYETVFGKAGRMKVRDIIADGLITGMSAAFLWHFSNIWRYGEYLVGEPNIFVRSLETLGLMAILVFGISKYVSDMKGKKKR
jgi:hypothetical protein